MLDRQTPTRLRWVVITAFSAAVAFGSVALADDEHDVVHDVQATEVGPTSAVVQWEPPPGRSPDTYRVQLQRGWSTTYMFAYENRIELTGLFPGQTYQIRIEVLFEPSTWSEPAEFTTVEVPAPATPTDIDATVEPGRVTLEWVPVEGAVDYVVRWTPHHTGVTVNEPSVVREMPPGGELGVTITARNEFRDESDPSEPLSLTVPPADDWEDLTAPTNLELVVSNGMIERIEWDPSDGGMDPVRYRLNYHFGDQGPDQAAFIAESSKPFIDVPGQIGALFECSRTAFPGQSWVIWVTAHSHGTTSPPSEQATVCLTP